MGNRPPKSRKRAPSENGSGFGSHRALTEHAQPPAEKSPLRQAREQVTKSNNLNLWFSRFASRTAQLVGHPYMFLAAVIALIIWGVSGPLFHFSDTWQLVINTGTTIVTFLVVFLIQNTQNRDAKALHLKLDELIRSHVPAHNDMIDIEKLSDEELEELENRYKAICEENEIRKTRKDDKQPIVDSQTKPAA